MLGAILGDVIGSTYEFSATSDPNFPLFTASSRFTDDTVCTVAIADAILRGISYKDSTIEWCNKYPDAGYGGYFTGWVIKDGPRLPYGSFGNGSAMRCSSTAYAFDTLEKVLEEATKSAEFTHNHPEGIKGAQATAAAIFMARTGSTKDEIKDYIVKTFNYDLDRTLQQVKDTHKWNATCQKTVPESIIAFLESTDFESAIRNAVLIKGDADTMAAISGSIAYAFYPEVSNELVVKTIEILDADLLSVVSAFHNKFIPKK